MRRLISAMRLLAPSSLTPPTGLVPPAGAATGTTGGGAGVGAAAGTTGTVGPPVAAGFCPSASGEDVTPLQLAKSDRMRELLREAGAQD